MLVISLFITAFGLGMIFNASPGAVFTETVRQGLIGGYRVALNVQIGSLVGDASWAVLGLAGAGVLFQVPEVRLPLSIVGGLYLVYLGVKSIIESPHVERLEVSGDGQLIKKSALFSGMSISLTNPQNILFWAALGSVLGGLGVENPTVAHYAVFFIGFMASSVLWCFACAAVVHVLHRTMSRGLIMGINLLCGLALFYIAYLNALDVSRVIGEVYF